MENSKRTLKTEEIIAMSKNSSSDKWISDLSAHTKIFEIVGLQFFTPKDVTEINVNRNPSLFRKAYAIFLAVLFTGLIGFIIRSDKDKNPISKVDINNVVVVTIRRASNNVLFFIIIICITQTYLCTKYFKKIYLNTKKVIELMKRNFNFDEDLSEFTRIARIRLILFPVCFTCLHLSFVAAPYFMTGKSDSVYFGVLVFYFVLLFMSLLTMRTVFYIKLTNHLMLKLKIILPEIFKPTRVSSGFIDVYKTLPLRATNHPPILYTSDLSSKLLALRKAYNLILENTDNLNKSSGLTLFYYMLGLIISTIVSEYEFFLLIVNGFDVYNVVNSSYGFVGCLILCGPIFFNCHRLRITVSRVNKMMNKLSFNAYSYYRHRR